MTKDEDLLTTAEVATHLGVSGARVRQYILAGDLPAHKHGRDIVIKRADLEAFTRPPIGRPRKGKGGEAPTPK